MCYAKQGDFELAWSPISELYGHNFGVDFYGEEKCCRRVCKNCFCGKLCCPIGS
jgi:hypothetical protein